MYLNKWISTYPHRLKTFSFQRKRILFVIKETAKQVIAVETTKTPCYTYTIHKNEILGVIKREHVKGLRIKIMDLKNEYSKERNELLKKYHQRMVDL